ncbi:SDR family oxidoreductase [Bauldia sp.]|uniref:SDR family oxidoreductase n=1 Tax=Bauldia sp. TaxID=2575872 RepID=UPI003BAD76DE
MAKLDGTVAVVTGGGTGIGRHISLALAAEGAQVAVVARRRQALEATVAEIATQSGTALAVPADLTDREATDTAFSEIAEALGPIDTLVNNAGAFSAIGPIWDVDPDVWWADVETNLRSTFHCARAVLPQMIARGSGHVINMIGGGTAAPLPAGSGYSASKTGVMRLTECIAATLDGTGVFCIAMAPGLVDTDMTRHQLSSDAGRKHMPGLAKRFAEGDFLPPTRAADLAVAIAKGHFNRLAGRAVSANERLADTSNAIPDIEDRDLRVLRLIGLGPTMKPIDT